MLTCIKRAFVKTLPVMAGYMVLGFGFGIITVEAGYGFWVALLMSVLIYAGSMQYVLVSLLTGGASLISGVVTTLMVNARHLFYGVSMVEKYNGAGRKK
ncbi:MAG: AzlC family ABC transporter permease, partial [Clostridia bacterium]|nr:AzlC family ABC transporter permease [Clostridia bacterium]